MDRNLVAGAVVVAIVAVAAAAILKDRHQDALRPTASSEPAPESRSAISVLVPEQQRVPDASQDAALVAHVEHKYRHLIGEIDREYVDELKRRLLARETEANLPVRERMDSDIGELLPAEDFEYYQALKDSELELTPEQHKMLKNYESTEVPRERSLLQQRINAN